MHRPDCPQPASSLIPLALAELGVFKKLSPPEEDTQVIGVNSCSDHKIIHNKIAKIREETGCEVQPLDCFGSFIRIVELCPGYTAAGREFILGEFKIAVQKRHAYVICAGAHGEDCAWCTDQGVTVMQRICLSREAKYVVKRAANPSDRPDDWWIPGRELKVFATYHRKYFKDGQWHQKTRVIDCQHRLFTQLSTAEVMQMTDQQVLERIAPHLLDLVAV